MTLITTTEAAALLKVTRKSVHMMAKDGRLSVRGTKPHPGGVVRLFDLREVEDVYRDRRSSTKRVKAKKKK